MSECSVIIIIFYQMVLRGKSKTWFAMLALSLPKHEVFFITLTWQSDPENNFICQPSVDKKPHCSSRKSSLDFFLQKEKIKQYIISLSDCKMSPTGYSRNTFQEMFFKCKILIAKGSSSFWMNFHHCSKDNISLHIKSSYKDTGTL